MDSSQAKLKKSPQISYLEETKKESPYLPLTSLDLQTQCSYNVKRLSEGTLNMLSSNTPSNSSSNQALSTDSIMKLAKERLLQIKSPRTDVLSNEVSGSGAQSDLPAEISEDLDLALLLQAAAEKVSNQQWIHAQKLLRMCARSASRNGNPVQRVVFYFAEALQERIDRECGKFSLEELEKETRKPIDVQQAEIHLQPVMMACQQELPFRLVVQFTAMQRILDSVASSKRVHLIDFGIENGSHWTILMQHFALRCDSPLELLKLTAVGSSKEMLEVTGKRLSSFAKSINLPFSFNIVVSDLDELKEDLFELEADEVVAMYLPLRLWTKLAWPDHLEAVLGVIKNLKPSVLVVKEMEANTNTPIFMDRFNEALILFSTIFDCNKACMDHQILYRKMTEEVIFREMIRNVVITEGSERIHRHERIGFWRTLFGRFGMVETDLSGKSICEATVLLRRSARFRSCTLNMDGKCLILGWKETPLISLSAWKFSSD